MLRPWELQIDLDLKDTKAVYLQIADAIIDAIKKNKLKSGDCLPGSRKLASLLKVNRNTVVQALNVLLIEGWLTTVERKGIFVAEILPAGSRVFSQDIDYPTEKNRPNPKPSIVFDDGFPDSKLAPIDALAKAYREIFSRKGRRQLMGYSEAQGDYPFREAISQMLNFKRNLTTDPSQIVVTRGSQMAMFLTSHCIIDKGDMVIIENPGYKPAWLAFENAGAKLVPVGVDEQGIVVEEIREILKKHTIKAIYITPHHQFPTTVTLSIKRRYELIELSNIHNFYLIEDDYDHEFHFAARPVFPVGSLAHIDNYVYIGTMSKIVAPALRIGYLFTNQTLTDKIVALRKIIDVQGDSMMEQAVLELIKEGAIKRHLKRVSAIYLKKRDYFENLLTAHLNTRVDFQKPNGGLAFWLKPKKEIDIFDLAARLERKGILILTPDKYSYREPIMGLRLGFASLTEDQLETGIKTLVPLLD
ncbi:PLP-dependent aminotransferase family protein [Algoriphagus sp. AGSA1]|uniref:MocR-like pyridoxine biosynthesis transcription factor PdxR n=1 Tax=unclassified Algoriphagus TaxID=2641541 RepID=UPI00177B3CA9|nr:MULTISPECIES: PLP-dependent aminotransferase family protein [unclassified Algoriphagus]MCE7056260.1 PLP-dependent aminotransferase family protein [Algoriphagus sp. AGSA1]